MFEEEVCNGRIGSMIFIGEEELKKRVTNSLSILLSNSDQKSNQLI